MAIVEISIFTVLAFSFDGHLALLVCIKKLRSRDLDILDPDSHSAVMGMFVRAGKTLVLNSARCWKMSVRKLQTKCNKVSVLHEHSVLFHVYLYLFVICLTLLIHECKN